MKLSYCGLSENQKEFLHNRYASKLEKFYYEKFKSAIVACFEIITSFCVGVSFSGFVLEEMLNIQYASRATREFSLVLGKNLLIAAFILWIFGYIVCVMKEKSVKEFIVDLTKVVGLFMTSSILVNCCGKLLWGLIKLLA